MGGLVLFLTHWLLCPDSVSLSTQKLGLQLLLGGRERGCSCQHIPMGHKVGEQWGNGANDFGDDLVVKDSE